MTIKNDPGLDNKKVGIDHPVDSDRFEHERDDEPESGFPIPSNGETIVEATAMPLQDNPQYIQNKNSIAFGGQNNNDKNCYVVEKRPYFYYPSLRGISRGTKKVAKKSASAAGYAMVGTARVAGHAVYYSGELFVYALFGLVEIAASGC